MENIELEGFHATLDKNAESIINEGFIINRKRTNEWLGHGIYF